MENGQLFGRKKAQKENGSRSFGAFCASLRLNPSSPLDELETQNSKQNE
jgi:hypothetical protein